MEILLSFLYLSIFVFVIYQSGFFNISGLSRKQISVFFLIKVMCGIALTFIYTYYYQQRETADIYKYFDDGKIMYSAIFNHPYDYLRMVTGLGSEAPDLDIYYKDVTYCHRGINYGLYNDYITIIRFNAAVCLFSFGYHSVHTIFMAFLSFVGLTALFKSFYTYLPNKKWELVVAVYFVPSVLLWTSGVLKEGIMMFGLGMFMFSFMKINKRFSVKYLLIFLFSVVVLFISKMYILIALIPGITVMIILKKTGYRFVILKVILVHLLFLLLAFNLTIFQYDFLHILSFKQQDFAHLVKTVGNVGSHIVIPELKPTWISFLKNAPNAFFNALFRPSIFESYSPIILLSALENAVLILLIFVSIFFSSLKKLIHKDLFFLCTSFVVILFVLSGLTTPVMGALVRYRAPALPFLLIALMMIFDKEKLMNFLSKIKRKPQIQQIPTN